MRRTVLHRRYSKTVTDSAWIVGLILLLAAPAVLDAQNSYDLTWRRAKRTDGEFTISRVDDSRILPLPTPTPRPSSENASDDTQDVPDEDAPVTPDLHDAATVRKLGEGAPEYFIPDVPHGWNDWENEWFSIAVGFAPIFDATAFTQDAQSLTQVGRQDSRWDIRSGRFNLHGALKFKRPVHYFIGAEYKGLDRSPEDGPFGFTDWWISILISKRIGTLTLGKQKESFTYELVGDSANFPFLERVLTPFFVTRNVGVKLSNPIFHDKMTWAVGWFNDWLVEDETFGESGNSVSARLTGVPIFSKDGSRYLHVAGSYRYSGAQNQTMRFRGRPESNTASNFVDTGEFPARYQNEVAFEALANRDGFSVLSEYVRTFVDTPGTGDPSFDGFYVTGSWVITGEHRPYDRKVGYARRIIPKKRYGAFEVVARYGYVNLNGGALHGGAYNKLFFGLNWWASRQWRISTSYGPTWLDRDGLNGFTQIFTTRFQWVF